MTDLHEEILDTVVYRGVTYLVGYEAGLVYFKPIDPPTDPLDNPLGVL